MEEVTYVVKFQIYHRQEGAKRRALSEDLSQRGQAMCLTVGGRRPLSLTWHSALFPDLPRGGEGERRRGVAMSCKGKRKQQDKTKISLR